MRIGIVPGLIAADGGVYQYAVTMLRALEEHPSVFRHDEFVVFADLQNPFVDILRSKGWFVKSLVPMTLKRRVINLAGRTVGPRPRQAALKVRNYFHKPVIGEVDLDTVKFNDELSSWFRSNHVDLMLYPISSSLSFETGLPYVMTVHDLQHRLQPEFPEVSANGEWENREYLFRNGIRKATLILAESETGKEDILNFYGQYGVGPDRIKVLPLLPSTMLISDVSEDDRRRVRSKYNLPERYVFYPAQFWPHKNHVRIIEALGSLKERYGFEIPIVLCGSHTGDIRQRTFNEVSSLAAKLQIGGQVHLLGYVSDHEIAALYRTARALVMPTFFGATNIPPLEAWAFGCPVLTSDIRGIREQAGDAAILVDPKSVEAIARGIYRLWIDDELCRQLVEKGMTRTRNFTLTDYANRLAAIIDEAKSRIETFSDRKPNTTC